MIGGSVTTAWVQTAALGGDSGCGSAALSVRANFDLLTDVLTIASSYYFVSYSTNCGSSSYGVLFVVSSLILSKRLGFAALGTFFPSVVFMLASLFLDLLILSGLVDKSTSSD